MSQISVFNNDPTNVTVNIVNGDPPVDQTALVAALQAQVAALQAKIDAAKADLA